MLTIVHSGQSGVERGAYRAAVAMGLPITGFMPATERDEFGSLPRLVRGCLEAHDAQGRSQAVLANVALASAALIIVPDIAKAQRYTGIQSTLKAVRSAGLPLKVCDPTTSVEEVVEWARSLSADGARLMVHGPRATRWEEGEALAWKLVATIATH
jgi:hypothetical protein